MTEIIGVVKMKFDKTLDGFKNVGAGLPAAQKRIAKDEMLISLRLNYQGKQKKRMTSTESFQRDLLNAPCEMPAVKILAAYSTSWKVKESIVSAAISERQMINVKSKACNPNKMEHKLTITHTDRLLWSKRLVTNWLLNAMATCK